MSAEDDLQYREFAKGTTIFKSGDEASEAYLLQNGSVDIVKERDGMENVIETLSRGDFLGEMALVDNARRSATAVAREDVTCAVFSKAEIDRSLENSDLLTYALIKLLTKRLRKATAGE